MRTIYENILKLEDMDAIFRALEIAIKQTQEKIKLNKETIKRQKEDFFGHYDTSELKKETEKLEYWLDKYKQVFYKVQEIFKSAS